MNTIQRFLKWRFGIGRPVNVIDQSCHFKDELCLFYIRNFPLDNILADIREQITEESLIQYYRQPDTIKNIVYSALEQKLNDLVDEYNAELLQDNKEPKPFNPNRAMEDAGHKQSDFM